MASSRGGGDRGIPRERFLARCADRLRQERNKAVERTRRGLPRADGERHRQAEEEELLRRMAKKEWERYKRSLESDMIDLEEEDEYVDDYEGEGGFSSPRFLCGWRN
jgi:hypothetical protein